MKTIICTKCGQEIELSEALTKDIENTIIAAEHEKHVAELERVKNETAEAMAKTVAEVETKARTEAAGKADLKLQVLQKESEEAVKDNKELREQLGALMQELRESKKTVANAEIEMQKKLAIEESKIREQAQKEADEKQRLNLAAKEKTITDLQKALNDAQRKAAQGSQQLQGEIMELDFETTLAEAFRDDDIEPVAKGVKGADIQQVVKSPRGTVCGVILWEVKRTKNWTEGWVQKLKDDLRATKANVPVIVSEVLPIESQSGIVLHNGIYVTLPASALILAGLLRKGLIDVGREKAVSQNRDTAAEALYSFVTSHEFGQQVEAMVEVYLEMIADVSKERAAFDRIWAKRESQAKKLLGSTTNIIGSMQGQIGSASMPRIKSLELIEDSETLIIE